MTTDPLRDLENEPEQLKRLVELSVTLNSTIDLDDLLRLIVGTATGLLECEAASILLYDEKNSRLFFAAATGSEPEKLAEIPVPLENSLAGTIFRSGQHLLLNNADQDPRHFTQVSDELQVSVKTLLGVPMRIKGRAVGVLEAINKRTGVFDDQDASLLAVAADHAAIAVHNAQLLRATRKALQRVQESDQLKSNFLALASHELRTPLGIIIGYSTFLQEESKDPLSSHASQVLNAASQMRSILDEMNNLVMLQSDELVLKPQQVAMEDLLTYACEGVRELIAARRQTLRYEFSEEAYLVNVDIDKTAQALGNLLDNAIRFSPEGSEIAVGVRKDGAQVRSWVRDQGVGIPSGKLEKIFDEFYQIEPPNTRHYGGLGIGLTIAKGLVEAQGGRIWAESEGPGKGATFYVLLPGASLK